MNGGNTRNSQVVPSVMKGEGSSKGRKITPI